MSGACVARRIADECHEYRDQRSRDEQDEGCGPGDRGGGSKDRQRENPCLERGDRVARQIDKEDIEFVADERCPFARRKRVAGKGRDTALHRHQRGAFGGDHLLPASERDMAAPAFKSVPQEPQSDIGQRRKERGEHGRPARDECTETIPDEQALRQHHQSRNDGREAGAPQAAHGTSLDRLQPGSGGIFGFLRGTQHEHLGKLCISNVSLRQKRPLEMTWIKFRRMARACLT